MARSSSWNTTPRRRLGSATRTCWGASSSAWRRSQRLAAEHRLRAIEGSDTILDTLLALHAEAGIGARPAIAVRGLGRRAHPAGAPHARPSTSGARGVPAAGRGAGRAGVSPMGHLTPARPAGDDRLQARAGRRVPGRPTGWTIRWWRRCATERPSWPTRSAASCCTRRPSSPCCRTSATPTCTPRRSWRPSHGHVPWTRRVDERRTTVGRPGASTCCRGRRSTAPDLVLKPNDDYGGRGVVLGWEVDDAAWTPRWLAVLAEPTVVQAARERGRRALSGVGRPARRRSRRGWWTLTRSATAAQHVHGVLTRLSAGGLLNVTAGGGSSHAHVRHRRLTGRSDQLAKERRMIPRQGAPVRSSSAT